MAIWLEPRLSNPVCQPLIPDKWRTLAPGGRRRGDGELRCRQTGTSDGNRGCTITNVKERSSSFASSLVCCLNVEVSIRNVSQALSSFVGGRRRGGAHLCYRQR